MNKTLIIERRKLLAELDRLINEVTEVLNELIKLTEFYDDANIDNQLFYNFKNILTTEYEHLKIGVKL